MAENNVTALDPINIDIQSNQDEIAYLKASYTLAKKNDCAITSQQDDNYKNSISYSQNVQTDKLVEKSKELSDQPCPVLLSTFDSLLEIEEQVFTRYPLNEINSSTNKVTKITPKGDTAIFNLGMASVICAAVKDVNPDAIRGDSSLFFSDSVTLYKNFHNFSFEESQKHQQELYDIITGEPVIKAQSLNSISGAKIYINQYIIKTGASNCNDIHTKANYILRKYGLHL
ncbi:hypothetical protein AB4430_19060 [Vibrio kanaloae]|uniref:hypothetical protein n=1 Tax=Vibrio kanaloae TaxID=170673 RepID=UPI0035526D8D